MVSIHNFGHLLPAKRELACNYRICGKSTDVCAHNASVAFDAGYHELAQIWGLVKLILLNQSTLVFHSESNILQRRGPMQRKDSAVDMSLDTGNHNQFFNGKGPQWGNHPFGASWLIPALFDHFEAIGDVQMVAMLSCALHECNSAEHFSHLQCEHDSLLPTIVEPAFPLDLHSDSTRAQNKPQAATPSLGSTPKENYPSGRSSGETWRGSSSTPPYSTGTTPPIARPGAISADRKSVSHNVSIATSPDQHSHPRSALGSVLASSFTRSFTFGPSSASPPTSTWGRKKQSPNGSPNTAGAWSNGALSAKPMSGTANHLMAPTTANSRTHSDTDSENQQALSKQSTRPRVIMKNQGAFDSVESAKDPFLDPKKDWLYRSYRTAYSRLLSIWGLPVQQSEILKIGGVVDGFSDPALGHMGGRQPRASFSFPALDPRNSQSLAANPENQGLEIQRHCSICGHSLHLSIFSTPSLTDATTTTDRQPQGSSVTCPNCSPKQLLPISVPCVICGEVVEGMLVPCLNCGHVSCFACHKEWFSNASVESGDKHTVPTPGHRNQQQQEFHLCPSGCGCNCAEHITAPISLPWASPTSPQSSPSPESERSRRHHYRHQQHRSHSRPSDPSKGPPPPSDRSPKVGQHEDDLELWQASPFTSLARGLGGGLSQGLRGKEEKRKSRPGVLGGGSSTFVPKRSSMNQVENG